MFTIRVSRKLNQIFLFRACRLPLFDFLVLAFYDFKFLPVFRQAEQVVTFFSFETLVWQPKDCCIIKKFVNHWIAEMKDIPCSVA